MIIKWKEKDVMNKAWEINQQERLDNVIMKIKMKR